MSVAIAEKLKLLKRLAARWPKDPVAYIRNYLKRELVPKQVEVARGLLNPPFRVLARSANNVGKTFLSAGLASWFFDSFDPSVTLATAPTKAQVRDLLFKELRTLRPLSLGFPPKDTRLQDAPNHFVHGIATQHGDAFQGRHEKNLFLIFDEATGIDRVFWDRGETMFGGHEGHAWLACYNPNDVASPAFAAEESGLWTLVTMSALEHPNIAAELAGLPPLVPSAIRLSRILDRIATECEPVAEAVLDDTCFEFPVGSGNWFMPKTAEFEVQVLGRWPGTAMQTVWAPTLWDRCQRQQTIDAAWPVQIGCDVARFGEDKTAFVVRKGRCLLHLEARGGLNTAEIAERLRQLATQYCPDSPRQVLCLVDETGGYGCGVIDQAQGFRFVGVNSAANAIDPRFPNTRCELWFNTIIAAEGGGVDLSRGGFLLSDLKHDCISVKYALDKKNRRRVESKQQTKARLKRSPDLADALNLAWYVPKE